MSEWLAAVVVIAVVLAVLLMRERWRVFRIAQWARTRGVTVRSPFLPDAQSPAPGLAGRFTAHGARRWGVALEGTVDGVPVTIAEFETTWAGARESRKWLTLAWWPASGPEGTVVIWRATGIKLFSTNARVDERLGVPGADPRTLRITTPGGLLVEAQPALREQWLTDERARALEAWPHGGEFARNGSHAAWRARGVLSVQQLEEMVERIPAARRLLA